MKGPVLAALAATLLAVGAASAGEPLIGGRLSVGNGAVTVLSDATMPVLVTLSASDPAVTMVPSSFTLAPGATGRADLNGPASGTLTALLTQLHPTGDASTVALVVQLRPYIPPADYRGALGALLLVGGLLLLARRLRPWQYRLARRG
jgi:hypothetical protein